MHLWINLGRKQRFNLRWVKCSCALRWSPAAHSRDFVCILFFVSCKTSQNVVISQILKWSKFKVSKQPPSCGCKALKRYALRSFSYHLLKNFTAVKINEAVGKRIWKASKIRYVFRNERYQFALHRARTNNLQCQS